MLRILQVLCGPALDFASEMRSTPQTLQVRCGPASNFASALRLGLNLCWTATHLQSLRSEANKCRGAKPQGTCKVRSILAKVFAVLCGNGNWWNKRQRQRSDFFYTPAPQSNTYSYGFSILSTHLLSLRTPPLSVNSVYKISRWYKSCITIL